jgi:stress response protein SCP2
MTSLTQGQRIAVASVAPSKKITIAIEMTAGFTVDLACFGVDAQAKLSDDRYMIFFNQPTSPCGSVRLSSPTTFALDLEQIPASIDKLVFTAAIDGVGEMSEIRPSAFRILEEGYVRATCVFAGDTFKAEKAVMLTEVYRKNGEWRINAVLQGFNKGLDALVRHFGGEVAEPSAASPAPSPAKVSLEKKIAAKAPALISLAKTAQISLEKAKLTDVVARVALVLDASGSMTGQYTGGHVQEVVNRLLPLAIHFDDDGEIDCWAFGNYPQRLSTVTTDNYVDFIKTDHGGWRDWELGSRINHEPRAMEAVINHYEKSGDKTPVYVLFISDGGVHENRLITAAMKRASSLPIFWQIVGLGGRDYGIFEKLDDMPGRVVDNCNFFALDRLSEISETELYSKMMEEFPAWLREAKSKGIIT